MVRFTEEIRIGKLNFCAVTNNVDRSSTDTNLSTDKRQHKTYTEVATGGVL